MKNTNVQKFNGEEVYSFLWNGRLCWIGIEVASMLGYENPSKIVNYFINSGNFLEGIDYEVLTREELKEFKIMLFSNGISRYKQSPKLVLFYESALVDFLKYRNKLSDLEIKEFMGENEDDNVNPNILMREFNGNNIYTFIWKGKPCWIATDIAKAFGYIDPSRTINNCIKSERFEKEFEYEILEGNNLRVFKDIVGDTISNKERVARLTIFYEDGLYGFLQYSEKPIGIEFRKWLRREVLPSLRKNKYYSLNEVKDEELDLSCGENLNSKPVDNLLKVQEADKMLEIIKTIDSIVRSNNENKLSDLKEILEMIFINEESGIF